MKAPLQLIGANAHTLETQWNGNQTVFVDYPSGPRGEQDRDLYAVQRQAGRPQAAKVTVGEHNGGDADVAAIGFANGDRDAAKELVIILTWDVNNAIVGGTFYQVQVFDDWKRGQRQLKQLRRLLLPILAAAAIAPWTMGPKSTSALRRLQRFDAS